MIALKLHVTLIVEHLLDMVHATTGSAFVVPIGLETIVRKEDVLWDAVPTGIAMFLKTTLVAATLDGKEVDATFQEFCLVKKFQNHLNALEELDLVDGATVPPLAMQETQLDLFMVLAQIGSLKPPKILELWHLQLFISLFAQYWF